MSCSIACTRLWLTSHGLRGEVGHALKSFSLDCKPLQVVECWTSFVSGFGWAGCCFAISYSSSLSKPWVHRGLLLPDQGRIHWIRVGYVGLIQVVFSKLKPFRTSHSSRSLLLAILHFLHPLTLNILFCPIKHENKLILWGLTPGKSVLWNLLVCHFPMQMGIYMVANSDRGDPRCEEVIARFVY